MVSSSVGDGWVGVLGWESAKLAHMRAYVQGSALTSALVYELGKQWLKGSGITGLPFFACLLAGIIQVSGKPKLGIGLAFGIAFWFVIWSLPTTANHSFANAIGLLVCAWSLSRAKRGSVSPEQLLRWLAFSVMFWSGIQKLLHGGYWDGEFLAYKLASAEARWHWLRLLADSSELYLANGESFGGPYRLRSPVLLLASRSVPVVEIILGLGLLWNRRSLVALVSLAFLLSIQLLAVEMAFALTALGVFSVFLDTRSAAWVARFSWTICAVLMFAAVYLPGQFN